jgi:hypothetical protein
MAQLLLIAILLQSGRLLLPIVSASFPLKSSEIN